MTSPRISLANSCRLDGAAGMRHGIGARHRRSVMVDDAPRHQASVTHSVRGCQAAASSNTVADQGAVHAGAPRGLRGRPLKYWLAGHCAKLHSPRGTPLDATHLGGLHPLIPAHVLDELARIIHPRASSHLAALDSPAPPASPQGAVGTLRRQLPLLGSSLAVACDRAGRAPGDPGSRAPLSRRRRARGHSARRVGATFASHRLGAMRSASVQCGRAEGTGAHCSSNFRWTQKFGPAPRNPPLGRRIVLAVVGHSVPPLHQPNR